MTIQTMASAASVAEGNIITDPGVELRRLREQQELLERQQRIDEDKAQEKNAIEQPSNVESAETSDISFHLEQVTFDASAILSEEELQGAALSYIGRDITVKELFDIVDAVNRIYAERGYVTCKAYLNEQTIDNGSVHISLLEGTTGTVDLTGAKHTKKSYIFDRLAIERGNVQDTHRLGRDLYRFNATNDVQLRVTMEAGRQPGTTDYHIVAMEPPQNVTVNFFADNGGAENSGVWREGIAFADRSLTGVRDPLSVTYMRAAGLDLGSLSYVRPVGRSGTKLMLDASINRTKGRLPSARRLGITGRAKYAGLTLAQPLITNPTTRAEARIGVSHQSSESELGNAGVLTGRKIENSANDLTLSFLHTSYGKSSVFFQRHDYIIGYNSNAKFIGDTEKQSYGVYRLSGIYQKVWSHGQIFSGKFNAQWSSTAELPSAQRFYLGGIYSVRGYKQDILSGDRGGLLSLEYAVPLDKARTISAYGFFDCGSLFGGNESSGDDYILMSTGVGVKALIHSQYYANLSIGFPLRRHIAGEDISKTRLQFSVNMSF